MLREILAASAFAAILSPLAALAEPTVGSCSPAHLKFMASDPLRFRLTSQSYVDLPQARVVFHQGGRVASCVLVRFSANANGAQGNFAVRALVDGVTTALPNEVTLTDTADVGPAARRFTFVLPSVTPGPHSVTIQYRRLNGTMSDMNAHNTIVWFAP